MEPSGQNVTANERTGKTIITIEMASDKAESLVARLPEFNKELEKLGLPPIESIRRVDEPKDSNKES